MENVRDAAISFEAVKLKLSQDRNGYVLHLSIHPNDIPDELLRSWVGARYTVAMVELDEHQQPVMSEAQQEGGKAIQLAGILCRDPDFQRFLGVQLGHAIFGMEECRTALCGVLGIKSRTELKDNAEVRKQFFDIRGDFNDWRGNK